MFALGWRNALNTQNPLSKLGDACGSSLTLLGVVLLRFRLGNSQLHVNFSVTPTLTTPHIIGTSFMYQHEKAIGFMDEMTETVRGSIRILDSDKMSAEEVEVDTHLDAQKGQEEYDFHRRQLLPHSSQDSQENERRLCHS